MKVELSKNEILAIIGKEFPGKTITSIEFNQKRVSDSTITIELVDACSDPIPDKKFEPEVSSSTKSEEDIFDMETSDGK